MIALLATILGIGLILFVHEAGHFLAARAAGVEVEVFSLGFGPRLVGFRRGNTDYRLSLLPLGGYVRMRGEEERPGSGATRGGLQGATPMWRLLIYSGGILMNFLFAFLLVPVLFTFGLPFESPVAGLVPAGTPAWDAGLRSGDRILAIGGREVHGFRNVATAVALSAEDEPLPVRVLRDGVESTLEMLPEYDRARGFRRVGLAPANEVVAIAGGAAEAAGIPAGTLLTALDGVPLAHPLATEVLLARALEHAGPMVVEGRVPGEDAARSWTLQLTPTVPAEAPSQLGVSLLQDTVEEARGALAGHLQPGDRLLSAGGLPVENLAGLAAAVLADGGLPELVVLRDADGERPQRATLGPRPDIDLAALADGLLLGPGEVERVAVRAGTAAAAAGLRSGDAVLRAGGDAVHDFAALRDAVLAHVTAGAEAGTTAPLELGVLREGEREPREFAVVLAALPINDLGLALAPLQEIVRSHGPLDAIRMGVAEARQMTLEVLLTLKRMISGEIDHRNLGGIISIGQVTHNFATQGLLPLLFFLCMVSVNLGVLNLLPIPALDGGHILFVLIEKLRGRPVSVGVQNAFNLIGVVLVLTLIVFVTTLDVNRLLQ